MTFAGQSLLLPPPCSNPTPWACSFSRKRARKHCSCTKLGPRTRCTSGQRVRYCCFPLAAFVQSQQLPTPPSCPSTSPAESTIITWHDFELNSDVAISFQEQVGCEHIWWVAVAHQQHTCNACRWDKLLRLLLLQQPSPLQFSCHSRLSTCSHCCAGTKLCRSKQRYRSERQKKVSQTIALPALTAPSFPGGPWHANPIGVVPLQTCSLQAGQAGRSPKR